MNKRMYGNEWKNMCFKILLLFELNVPFKKLWRNMATPRATLASQWRNSCNQKFIELWGQNKKVKLVLLEISQQGLHEKEISSKQSEYQDSRKMCHKFHIASLVLASYTDVPLARHAILVTQSFLQWDCVTRQKSVCVGGYPCVHVGDWNIQQRQLNPSSWS